MKKIDWSEYARADVRRIDRTMAMRIFTTIQRFAETGEGDVLVHPRIIRRAESRVRPALFLFDFLRQFAKLFGLLVACLYCTCASCREFSVVRIGTKASSSVATSRA